VIVNWGLIVVAALFLFVVLGAVGSRIYDKRREHGLPLGPAVHTLKSYAEDYREAPEDLRKDYYSGHTQETRLAHNTGYYRGYIVAVVDAMTWSRRINPPVAGEYGSRYRDDIWDVVEEYMEKSYGILNNPAIEAVMSALEEKWSSQKKKRRTLADLLFERRYPSDRW